jgi:FKBP-type peptidyl-prolyl cis-trans isomerase
MKKLLFIAPLAMLFSCGSDEPEVIEKDYEETEYDIQVSEYLSDKSWDMDRQESGLYIYVENAGSDEKPQLTDYLTLKYTGYLLDGTVFDGTDGQAISFPFPMSNLIMGWQEGIPSFGKGGKGKLIIPPNLGYGDQDSGPIPANSVLVFDIEIIDFSDSPAPPTITKTADYTEEIEGYIKKENIKDITATEDGMYVKIDNAGGEEKPTLGSFLTLNYTGYLLDGTVFDGTEDTPATFPFPVSQLIPGWQLGIPMFGKGGKGKLIIPPYMGYGDQATGEIPANSVLVFDIEVIDFTDNPPSQF